MRMEKKICAGLLTITLCVTNSSALPIDIGKIIGSATEWIQNTINSSASILMNEILESMNNPVENGLSICYVKEEKKAKANLGMCDYVKEIEFEKDICELAPPIPGYKKKKNVLSANTDLNELCKSAEEYARSIATDVDLFNKGQTEEEAKENDKKLEIKNLVSKDSVARNAFLSGNQDVMRLLRDYSGKNENIKNINEIQVSDLAAPKTLADYRSQRELMANAVIEDYLSNGLVEASAEMRTTANNEIDTKKAFKTTGNISSEYSDVIDLNTKRRIQMYIDVFAKDDDIAIPTQDMIGLLTDEAKLETIAKINKQLKREALIMSELRQIDKSRKNIHAIIAQKSVIVSREFNRTKAAEDIEQQLSPKTSSE